MKHLHTIKKTFIINFEAKVKKTTGFSSRECRQKNGLASIKMRQDAVLRKVKLKPYGSGKSCAFTMELQ